MPQHSVEAVEVCMPRAGSMLRFALGVQVCLQGQVAHDHLVQVGVGMMWSSWCGLCVHFFMTVRLWAVPAVRHDR